MTSPAEAAAWMPQLIGMHWLEGKVKPCQSSLICVTAEHINKVYTAVRPNIATGKPPLAGLLNNSILCGTDRIHDIPCRLSSLLFLSDFSNGSRFLPLQQLASVHSAGQVAARTGDPTWGSLHPALATAKYT